MFEFGVQYSLREYPDTMYVVALETQSQAEQILDVFGSDDRTATIKLVKRQVGEWQDA